MTIFRMLLLFCMSVIWAYLNDPISEWLLPGNVGFNFAFRFVTCAALGWYWSAICDQLGIPGANWKLGEAAKRDAIKQLAAIEYYVKTHPKDLATKVKYEKLKKQAERAGLFK